MRRCVSDEDLSRVAASDTGTVVLARAALKRSLIDPAGAMLAINCPARAVTRDGRTIRDRSLTL